MCFTSDYGLSDGGTYYKVSNECSGKTFIDIWKFQTKKTEKENIWKYQNIKQRNYGQPQNLGNFPRPPIPTAINKRLWYSHLATLAKRLEMIEQS